MLRWLERIERQSREKEKDIFQTARDPSSRAEFTAEECENHYSLWHSRADTAAKWALECVCMTHGDQSDEACRVRERLGEYAEEARQKYRCLNEKEKEDLEEGECEAEEEDE